MAKWTTNRPILDPLPPTPKQRMGTLWCWMFGHLCTNTRKIMIGYTTYRTNTPTDYCIRCGQPRE